MKNSVGKSTSNKAKGARTAGRPSRSTDSKFITLRGVESLEDFVTILTKEISESALDATHKKTAIGILNSGAAKIKRRFETI